MLLRKQNFCVILKMDKATDPKGSVAMFVKGTQNTALPMLHPYDSQENHERRYLPRWEVNNKIFYSKDNELNLNECRSKDINCTGACIRNEEKILPNQQLSLTIVLAENIDPVYVHGKVVWQLERGQEYWTGIRFDRVSDKTSELIFHYAFEFKREELLKSWFKGF